MRKREKNGAKGRRESVKRQRAIKFCFIHTISSIFIHTVVFIIIYQYYVWIFENGVMSTQPP